MKWFENVAFCNAQAKIHAPGNTWLGFLLPALSARATGNPAALFCCPVPKTSKEIRSSGPRQTRGSGFFVN
jgi:hypothetical protein